MVDNLSYFHLFYKDYIEGKWKTSDILIREISKKVYIKFPEANHETLLYDFNLNVHDSILIYSNYWIVKAVDSIKINNIYRKTLDLRQLHFKSWEADKGDKWIEGVGSIHGLLSLGGNDPNSYSHLLCAKNQDGILYQDPECECCEIILNIKESNIFGLKLYPTIISNRLNITTNSTNIKYLYKLYDLEGRLLNQNVYYGSQVIDCSSLNNGIYFIQLTGKNTNITKKIIKE